MAANDCIVSCTVHTRNKRTVQIHRTYVPVDDSDAAIYAGALKMMLKHKRRYEFIGCGVNISTPDKEIEVIFENHFSEYSLVSLDNKVLAKESV